MESTATTPEARVDEEVDPQSTPEAPPEPSTPVGDKADAARDEVKDETKVVEFKGLTVTLPKKVPFRVLRYARNEEEAAGADTYWTLHAIIGEEQMEKVDAALDIDEGAELLDRVIGAMGMNLGESSASGDS